MRLKTVSLAFALAAVGGAAGCTHTSSSGAGGMAKPVEATTLKVVNQGSLDMDVYVLRAPVGQRIRLGTATGNSTTRMRIPNDVMLGSNTSLRFVADPIGGTRPSVSSSILVTPGDEVTLEIPPY
jgi:hypothetical protein